MDNEETLPGDAIASGDPVTREALLEKIQQGQLVVLDGRTAHGEAGLDFLLTSASASLPLSGDEPTSDTKGLTDELSTLVLTPGSVVYVADGSLPPAGESDQPGYRWNAPGDFKLYLQDSDNDHPGKVREVLVGSWRDFNNADDHEIPEGNFLTELDWDAVVGSAQREAWQFSQQIGLLRGEPQAQEQLPRGDSWLAERADSDAKLAAANGELSRLQASVSELEAQVAELTAAIAKREETLVPTGSPAPNPATLPAPKAPKTKQGGE